jgi:hypothetical protein
MLTNENVLNLISTNSISIYDIPQEYLNDRHTALFILDNYNLESPIDKHFKPENILLHFNEDLRNDEHIVLTSSTRFGLASLKNMGQKLKINKKFAKKLSNLNTDSFEYFDESIKSDKALLYSLMKSSGAKIVKFAANDLKNDKDFVWNAIKCFGLSNYYNYMSKELKNDEKFMRELLLYDSSIYHRLNPMFQDKEEFLHIATLADGISLIYASERLQNNFQTMLDLIDINPTSFVYMNKEFINDKTLLTKFIQIVEKDNKQEDFGNFYTERLAVLDFYHKEDELNNVLKHISKKSHPSPKLKI